MSTWSAGYTADLDYTYGYYGELNPLRIRLAFLHSRVKFPEVGTACELGFGQGVSLALHAAASMTEWHGTDFNPAQAGFAQELASASGKHAGIHDQSFAEFALREDLPDFDFIGLHGIWSWVSDENRAIIVDFIRRKLKVGGVLFVSYNTLPGWSSFLSLRHLMTQHAEIMSAPGAGTVGRIDSAIDFTGKLLDADPLFAKALPYLRDRLEKVKGQDRHYLAHEYFNRDWAPMHFADMANWLAPAKLQFACSAYLPDLIDNINLTPAQRLLLEEIPDPLFRQTIRDYCVNQVFRRDYWVKGLRTLTLQEQEAGLRALRVLLIRPRQDVEFRFTGVLGEAKGAEHIYGPIFDMLANHGVFTVGDIADALADRGITLAQITEVLLLMTGTGALALAQDDTTCQQAGDVADRQNAHLIKTASVNDHVQFLASPVTGGGYYVPHMEQLFLSALRKGDATATALAEKVWIHLSSQNRFIVKDGKALEERGEAMAELERIANEFLAIRLPLLRALHIAR